MQSGHLQDELMGMAVLATKLFAPSPRAQAVSRPRLVSRLTAGLQAGQKLTLVSAPAGFGKTTLFGEWIAQMRAQDPQVRVAWLSLDGSDNDPVRFLTYPSAMRSSSCSIIFRPKCMLP